MTESPAMNSESNHLADPRTTEAGGGWGSAFFPARTSTVAFPAPALDTRRCLRRRAPAAACHTCADECSAAAISLLEDGISIAAVCVGCMRCASKCPTEALTRPGLDADELGAISSRAERIRIECSRAPEAGTVEEGVLRVACLGSLSFNDFLRLRLAAGNRPLELVDRGLCGDCRAAADGKMPGSGTRDEIAQRFREMALVRLAPRVVKSPATGRPSYSAAARRSRRGFLKRLASLPNSSADGGIPDIEAPVLERAALFQRISVRWSRPVPASAFPTLQISDACRDHHVCVAVCPTHAIGAYRDGETSGITLDARRCIACGACAAVCPEKAVSLARQPAGFPAETSTRLTAHAMRVCARCEDEFAVAAADEEMCPDCRKSEALSVSIFGSRPPAAEGSESDLTRSSSP